MSSNNAPIQVTGWTEERLIDLCEFINRGKAPQYVIQSSVKAIGQRCVREKFQGNEARFQDQKKIEGHLFAKKGDVLLNSTGTGTIGRSCVFDEDMAYIVDGHVTVVRPYQQKCSSSLLNSLLKTSQYQRYFEIYCYTGSTNQIELSSAAVAGVKLWLPSRNEQQAIAIILDTMDEAIRQTEAVLHKLRQVKAGMLHDLLTRGLDENGELRDPIRHPEQFKASPVGWIPKEWDVQAFEVVCLKIQDGTHFSPASTSGPCLYITSKNIRLGYMDLTCVGRIIQKEHDEIYRRCDVRKGDVLLTKDGANTGNAAINEIEEQFSLLSSVALLRCDEIKLHNQFLLQTLLSPMFQRNIQDSMSGNAITRLTLRKINNFQIALPHYEEQLCISKCLNSHQEKLAVEERNCEKLKIAKQGLMHDLLTGTVRVPQHLIGG